MNISDYVVNNRVDGHSWLTHRLVCNDGFHVSVQASKFHYCYPREDDQPAYFEFELGMPSEHPGDELASYAEDKDDLLSTVYGYVPADVVQRLVDSHGGIAGQFKEQQS